MKSTRTEQLEQDNAQSSANTNTETASSEKTELIKRDNIHGTPFLLINTPEKGWFATYKNYQLTKDCKDQQEVIEEINYNTWHIILLMIQIVIVETDNLKAKLQEGDQLGVENNIGK